MGCFFQDHYAVVETDHCKHDHDILHGSWLDFIFAKVIAGADPRYYTVAIGLYTMLTKENIVNWYACFAAGAVCVSIPIAILFLYLQKYYAEGMSGAVKG